MRHELILPLLLVTIMALGNGCNGTDSPTPTASSGERETTSTEPGETKTAVFAGGCFWCTEAVFQSLDGVSSVVSGYAGGDEATANYEMVCSGATNHAEAVEITYDPAKVDFDQLLEIFFVSHDPTTLNRQGPDSGTQYRSAIFYADEGQQAAAAAYIEKLNAEGQYGKPIVTTLEPLESFYAAEDYHQDFADKNPDHPYIRINAAPKVEKVKKLRK